MFVRINSSERNLFWNWCTGHLFSASWKCAVFKDLYGGILSYLAKVFGGLFCAMFFVPGAFASTCPSGYATLDAEKHIDTTYKTFSESTFMAVEDGLCKIGGYSLIEIPDDIRPVFNGFVMGNEVKVCDNGYQPNNGDCVPYTKGTCNGDANVHDWNLALDSASFMATEDGLCKIGGYSIIEIPDDLYPKYNGFVMGSEIALCTNGYRSNNTSCVDYAMGECPTNYVDLALNDNTFAKLTDGACASGYSKYVINQQCNQNTTDSMCAILCSNGLEYTDVGTCAALCPSEHHTLKTSTGLSFPLYATKQITPSINIQMGDDICYVNLVNGRASDAINVQYDNKIYHTVK